MPFFRITSSLMYFIRGTYSHIHHYTHTEAQGDNIEKVAVDTIGALKLIPKEAQMRMLTSKSTFHFVPFGKNAESNLVFPCFFLSQCFSLDDVQGGRR